MKKIIYIVAGLALITITVIRLKSNKETTLNRVFHYNKEQALNVQVLIIKQESIKNDISYIGTFEPNKETKVSAEVQGKINKVLVDLGSTVKKGQPLIQLDNSLLKLQLQTVEIQIEGLETDVNRYTILANADAIQGVQLEKTELALKSAKVQKATLLEQINKTTIVAPFSGIITAKLTEEGAFASPGIPLLQITDISMLKFTINVPEQEIDHFKIDQRYSLYADAYPQSMLSGKVILIGSKANIGNSFPVQFSVRNTINLTIKSGMFGNVEFKNDTSKIHIAIPASSIVGTNLQPQVYKVKNWKTTLQNVTISSRYQNNVVISSGLSKGDTIVTNGFINLFDGANVFISKK
ncbi:MAG TPA: efflux RND transporter periplasmic adaptor subunit [Williamwhitmania sp.]|nr:efflux RND transporter periplasmic adaptor subunit [Williamwhitmania sp.]